MVAAASYYNLKHLFFSDVDFGVINCLKTYNALALVFEFLCIAEMIANSRGSEMAALIIGIVMGIVQSNYKYFGFVLPAATFISVLLGQYKSFRYKKQQKNPSVC